jgi:hypothetical protein
MLYTSVLYIGPFVYFIFVEQLKPLDVITGSTHRSSQVRQARLFCQLSAPPVNTSAAHRHVFLFRVASLEWHLHCRPFFAVKRYGNARTIIAPVRQAFFSFWICFIHCLCSPQRCRSRRAFPCVLQGRCTCPCYPCFSPRIHFQAVFCYAMILKQITSLTLSIFSSPLCTQ